MPELALCAGRRDFMQVRLVGRTVGVGCVIGGKILAPCTLGMANPVTRKFHPSFGIIHLTIEPTFTISLDNKLSYVEFTDCCSLM